MLIILPWHETLINASPLRSPRIVSLHKTLVVNPVHPKVANFFREIQGMWKIALSARTRSGIKNNYEICLLKPIKRNRMENTLFEPLDEAGAVRLLRMEKEWLVFEFYEGKNLRNEIRLKTGYETIVQRFFKRSIPTESEIEYTINYIEDELMSRLKELQNRNEKLVCADKMLADIFKRNYELKNSYSRRNIEDLFTRYAYISMGQPLASSRLTVRANDFAILLLLREILHHLDFKKLTLIRKQ